ncbi:hypothetical protein Cni_G20131 [Canna indica]|uniref:CHHC U11-48K-type domain-containing protein n=1 Tax=Canna indica TaxID=4628 RepID=A0AAQ3QHI2_9LILI|nr:hypothetical protein Cni_G20131 [Canna indica]
MDPAPSFFRPSMLLAPQNPNPNANPTQTPPAADLPTAISLLGDLTALAESTLKSVTNFLSLSPSAAVRAGGFSRCPYDPNHRMPPEYLFRHSLVCAAAPGTPLVDLGFLDELRYLGSLKSESELRKENAFVQSLPAPDADLCFSLDAQLGDLGSNFFYKDCPGVVTTSEPDVSNATFTLPGILSMECANFVCDREEDSWAFGEGVIRILPSEYWAMRCEVEAWNEFPFSYSYTVLRVMPHLTSVEEDGLKRWLISNSPRFGIVIDVAMREHIFLLLKLCLKVIGREACSSYKLLMNKAELVDPKALTFKCSRLVKSFTWLVSQMSVLYGEANAKLFSFAMLKESLLQAASGLLLTRLGGEKLQKDGCINVNGACVDMRCDMNEIKLFGDVKVNNPSNEVRSKVFVSQVAAAVAAIHEKSLLEERIRSLRFAQPLSKSQLILEYSHALARGCEERGKRPNYRPVSEHDGFLWHRALNQDLDKAKTREQLLAEERDYKRRRMSYRGKKVKRNPTEVIRDIIEEHMEEIKEAGGIGSDAKFTADASVFTTKHDTQNDVTSELYKSSSNEFDLSDTRRNLPHKSHGDDDQSHTSHSKLRYEKYEHWEQDRNAHERQKNYGSSSSSTRRSYTSSHNRNAHEREHADVSSHGREYNRDCFGYFSRSRDHRSQSTLTSNSPRKEYDYLSRNSSKERGRYSENSRSESVMQEAFEDRYNPSSYDDYDTTYAVESADNSYSSSDKLYSSRYDDKYHHERRRNDHSSRRHIKDHK